jgi:hypothetical protein
LFAAEDATKVAAAVDSGFLDPQQAAQYYKLNADGKADFSLRYDLWKCWQSGVMTSDEVQSVYNMSPEERKSTFELSENKSLLSRNMALVYGVENGLISGQELDGVVNGKYDEKSEATVMLRLRLLRQLDYSSKSEQEQASLGNASLDELRKLHNDRLGSIFLNLHNDSIGPMELISRGPLGGLE